MNNLFVFAAHNTVVAILFAIFVYGLTRIRRNPPVAHVLWLLVLLKLVAPPVMYLDWSPLQVIESTPMRDQIITDAPRIEELKAISSVDLPVAQATSAEVDNYVVDVGQFWNYARPLLFWLWLGGAALCALIAAMRTVRFERRLRDTLPASERLQQITLEIANKLGIRRAPDVRYVECVEVPLLWCAGRRPTIALPMRLLSQLDDQQAALVLAHELAHLRRRDHWVRVVELIVATVYWWNPLVWLIRRQIHQAEDLCCDAWVRWTFPDCTRRYAEVLLKAAESLSASRVGARLLPASPFLRSLSLKARIEMILESRFAPRVSKRSMLLIALLAFLVLPSFVEITKTKALAGSNDEAVAKSDSPSNSEFPYKVKFEQGATRFADGDKITILEVRGTAEAFTPGNIYWIKGTYTLASRDKAILLASTTVTDLGGGLSRLDMAVSDDSVHPGQAIVKDPGSATGLELKVQRADINRGTGSFTLFLPMKWKGAPHISFYSTEKGGEGFGGNYFGTGDSVLKQWWGSKETAQTDASKVSTHLPQIIKTIPKLGETGVDSGLKEIVVVFDRDMSQGMSWTGGPPLFPAVDKDRPAKWTDGRTCILPVKLDRARFYRVGINSTGYQNFRSSDGVAAPPSSIYFVTQGATSEIEDYVRVPEIVALKPENGAQNVDPKTAKLTVTFNMPMGQGMSWTGEGQKYPPLPTGKQASWSADGLTCTLPVTLAAGHDYELGLNSTNHINFQSKWGVPLKPVTYRFRTRDE